jgi:hypothetical protein
MEAGMKPPVLAKISMQVGDYFKKAFELSLTNTGLKNYDSSKFSNVMQYHSLYFTAMSYNVLAMEEFKKVNETSQGMGKAVSMFKATMVQMEKAKPVVLLIPSNYQDNFNNKYADITKLMNKAITENKSIYFERETPVDQIPKPDL